MPTTARTINTRVCANEDIEMTDPTIRFIRESAGSRHYRVEGGDIDPEWAAGLRPGRAAWCEISTYDGKVIASYGGEVWPGAWPRLFHVGPPSVHVGSTTTITPEGRALLLLADLADDFSQDEDKRAADAFASSLNLKETQ